MAGYIGSKASVVSSGAERKKVFTITTTTTSLTGLAYTPTKVHVFHNGIRLVDGTDYTATNGTSITLTNAAENGDEVVVVSYASFQVADAYTQAESDVRYVQVTGDTMTGALTGTDLTLSGGVYLGGTGSANKISDYETGTWDPNIADDTGVKSTHTGQGKYVKVGNLVFVTARIFGGSAFTSTGTVYIPLPFAPSGNQNQVIANVIYTSGAGGTRGVFILDGNGYLNFTDNISNPLSNTVPSGTSFSSSSKRLYFGPIVYTTA